MITGDKMREKKLQYDVNIVTTKMSASLSGKIDKYDYVTNEEVLAPQQHRIIQGVKFFYSSLWKTLEKQVKGIDEQWGK